MTELDGIVLTDNLLRRYPPVPHNKCRHWGAFESSSPLQQRLIFRRNPGDEPTGAGYTGRSDHF